MTQPPQPAPNAPTPAARPAAVAAALLAVFGIIAAILITSGRISQRVHHDQRVYHEFAIRQFESQWPKPDLSDYASATTPGYHLLLAAISHYISGNIAVLQTASALISAALVASLGFWVGRFTPPRRAIFLCLPFATSIYITESGAWLLPDNLAWLGVLTILILALSTRFSASSIILGGLVLLALVFTRQIAIWTAALLWAAAWLSPPLEGEGPWHQRLLSDPERRAKLTFGAMLATLPAFGLLFWFWKLWGQNLTPPRFVGLHQSGLNLAAPAFVLAMIGLFSGVFIVTLIAPLREAWSKHRLWVIGAALAALVLALAAPTTFNMDAGRWTGIWSIARRLPTIGHTSPFITALAAFGALALAAWLSVLSLRERLLILAALAAFSAAQAANAQLWQRYVEPLALMLVVLFAAKTAPPRRAASEFALPLLAALAFTAISLNVLRSPLRVDTPLPPDVTPGQPPPPIQTPQP